MSVINKLHPVWLEGLAKRILAIQAIISFYGHKYLSDFKVNLRQNLFIG